MTEADDIQLAFYLQDHNAYIDRRIGGQWERLAAILVQSDHLAALSLARDGNEFVLRLSFDVPLPRVPTMGAHIGIEKAIGDHDESEGE